MGVLSIDRTRDGIALKLGERARVEPEKLMALVSQRKGANFAPSRVLRLELDDLEKGRVLEVTRRALLQIKASG